MRTPGISAEVAQPSRMHQCTMNGVGHDVAKKSQSGNDGAEGRWLRNDVEERDFDHVAGLGALDEDRSGQRMHEIAIETRQIGDTRLRADLPVAGVARLQHHLVALGDLKDRRNVGVKTIVTAVRLGRQGFRAVDADGVHGLASAWHGCGFEINETCKKAQQGFQIIASAGRVRRSACSRGRRGLVQRSTIPVFLKMPDGRVDSYVLITYIIPA